MQIMLLKLIAHMRWADEMVADSLTAYDSAQRRDAPSTDPVGLLAHIAAAEHLWYSRVEGSTPAHAVWPDLSIDASRALAMQTAGLFEDLVVGGGDAGLERVVSYRNSAGRDFRNTVSDIVMHVTMHGSYHRGQIARIIRASGGDPPYTDYIQFARREQMA
jgi:uncharacterized damage-inducible protein DinB